MRSFTSAASAYLKFLILNWDVPVYSPQSLIESSLRFAARPNSRRPHPDKSPLMGCAVKRRWSTAGVNPPGNWFAPPGSNQSSSGGNETAEASGAESRKGDLASVQGVT